MTELMNVRVVVSGAEAAAVPPSLPKLAGPGVDVRFAPDLAALRRELPAADVVFAWDNGSTDLVGAWPAAARVRWVQGVGAGIDRLLFPALVESDVVLTNAHGMFDITMGEYAMALILASAKQLKRSIEMQQRREWVYRPLRRVAETRLLVVGAGPTGRAIARAGGALGMRAIVVGRTAREDPEFGRIEAAESLVALLPDADWVVVSVPLTPGTRGLIGPREFAAMKAGAVFVNVGRGPVVDEGALIEALRDGRLGGAGLDVFEHEPLPADSPLWEMPNVIISSHVAGDYPGYEDELVALFGENLSRYRAGQPLLNVVDKRLGYVAE